MNHPQPPPEVAAVAAAMRENAVACGLTERAVWVHFDTEVPSQPEWRVSDNFECGMGSLIYYGGAWYRRSMYLAEDDPIAGGQAGAIEAARHTFRTILRR